MKKIDWKSLSLSLILSIILNGGIGLYLLIQHIHRAWLFFDSILFEYADLLEKTTSEISNSSLNISGFHGQNTSNMIYFSGYVDPPYMLIFLLLISFVCTTVVLYFSMVFYKKMKK